MAENDHPRISRVTGTTVELREHVEAGDRRTLLLDVVVREAGGIRKTSDGDVEPIHYKALDILDVTGVDAASQLLEDARLERKRENDERNGTNPLPGIDDEPIYVIGFACGHEVFYPEAWMAREESDDEVEATYWREQVMPVVDGTSPCPKCDGPRGELRKVESVGLVGDPTEKPKGHAAPAPTGDPAVDEPWQGYKDAKVGEIREWLGGMPDEAERRTLALACAAYEAGHKNRSRVLNYLDTILDPAPAPEGAE